MKAKCKKGNKPYDKEVLASVVRAAFEHCRPKKPTNEILEVAKLLGMLEVKSEIVWFIDRGFKGNDIDKNYIVSMRPLLSFKGVI